MTQEKSISTLRTNQIHGIDSIQIFGIELLWSCSPEQHKPSIPEHVQQLQLRKIFETLVWQIREQRNLPLFSFSIYTSQPLHFSFPGTSILLLDLADMHIEHSPALINRQSPSITDRARVLSHWSSMDRAVTTPGSPLVSGSTTPSTPRSSANAPRSPSASRANSLLPDRVSRSMYRTGRRSTFVSNTGSEAQSSSKSPSPTRTVLSGGQGGPYSSDTRSRTPSGVKGPTHPSPCCRCRVGCP